MDKLEIFGSGERLEISQKGHVTAKDQLRSKPKIDIDAEWKEWKQKHNIEATPEGTPPPERGGLMRSPPPEEYLRADDWETGTGLTGCMGLESPPKEAGITRLFPRGTGTVHVKDDNRDYYERILQENKRESDSTSYNCAQRGEDSYLDEGKAYLKVVEGSSRFDHNAIAYPGKKAVLSKNDVYNIHQKSGQPGINKHDVVLDGSDLEAGRYLHKESEILQLHRAAQSILDAELQRLKDQSREQKHHLHRQLNDLKSEAYKLQVQHQKSLYEDFLNINKIINPPIATWKDSESERLTNYEMGLSGWNHDPRPRQLNEAGHDGAKPTLLDASGLLTKGIQHASSGIPLLAQSELVNAEISASAFGAASQVQTKLARNEEELRKRLFNQDEVLRGIMDNVVRDAVVAVVQGVPESFRTAGNDESDVPVVKKNFRPTIQMCPDREETDESDTAKDVAIPVQLFYTAEDEAVLKPQETSETQVPGFQNVPALSNLSPTLGDSSTGDSPAGHTRVTFSPGVHGPFGSAEAGGDSSGGSAATTILAGKNLKDPTDVDP